MKSKKTSKKQTGAGLIALILDTYQEYVSNKYPRDPNIYLIRTNNNTLNILKKLDKLAINPREEKKIKNTFMGFRIEVDGSLKDNEIIFGPETVKIELEGDL